MTHITDTVQYLQSQYPDFKPEYALILGSGLGDLAQTLDKAITLPYANIPGFPQQLVAGHAGQLVMGYLHQTPILCFQGRVHYYEGTPVHRLKHLIRTMSAMGCHSLIATNAAGSLQPHITPGSFVLIVDHINLQGTNPLVGPNEEEFGPRFLSLDQVYDTELRKQFIRAAQEARIPLHQGVYVATLGPVFETPAEVRAFRMLGADVVGMSTVPDVILARHCGLRVAVLSVVTNLGAGMSEVKLSHEHTLQTAKQSSQQFIQLMHHFFSIL